MPRKFLAYGVIALLCLAAMPALAQTAVKIPSKYSRFKSVINKNLDITLSGLNKNYLREISVSEGEVPLQVKNLQTVAAVGKQFFKEYGAQFGVKNFAKDLKLTLTRVDEFGEHHAFYKQYYNNIPVFGGEILLRADTNLKILSSRGKFFPNLSLNTNPLIKKDKAQKLALAIATQDQFNKGFVKDIKLTIYNPRVFNTKAADKNYLAWNVVLEDASNWRERVILDAKTGKTLIKYPLVKTAWFSDAMDFSTRGLFGSDTISRRVYDCRPDGCTQNSVVGEHATITLPAVARAEGSAATGAADVDTLYDLLAGPFNYFKDTFDYWGGNGMGGMGWMTNADYPLLNTNALAYVIGTTTMGICPNAWGGAGALKFCDGIPDRVVVGHEYMHAMSDFNMPDSYGFEYQGESGAIEEAYADIFGQAVQRYADGASSWTIGDPPTVWRNLMDPSGANPGTNCPCPERQYGPNFYCGANDKGGVHWNSTVGSHMAYILSVGGNLNGCAVDSIGQEKVERIFYHAFRNNLPSVPDFSDLYSGLRDSCFTLYGIFSDECKNLIIAMQGAELDQDLACGAVPTAPLCSFNPRGLLQFGIKEFKVIEIPKTPIMPPVVPYYELNNKVDIEVPPEVTAPVAPIIPIAPEIETPPVFTPPVKITPPADAPAAPAPVVEEYDRTPSFTVDVIQNGKNVTVNGVLNYYGKGSKCSGPRYFTPIIVAWGQVNSHPALVGNTFTASHEYIVRNKEYNLSVSVTNSCFGSYVFHKTLTFPL